jgi:hypothetical protein
VSSFYCDLKFSTAPLTYFPLVNVVGFHRINPAFLNASSGVFADEYDPLLPFHHQSFSFVRSNRVFGFIPRTAAPSWASALHWLHTILRIPASDTSSWL